MRAPFNTTCDIFQGPNGAVPGAFIGTFDCRLVEEDGISTVGTGAPDIPYYLTIDDYQPRGMWVAPFLQVDPAVSDQIAVPSGSAARFWVLYTDIIVWGNRPYYYRAYLVDLPLPANFSGGTVCNGSADVLFSHVFIGDGGMKVGGSAEVIPGSAYLPTGGMKVGGSAEVIPGSAYIPTGGMKIG